MSVISQNTSSFLSPNSFRQEASKVLRSREDCARYQTAAINSGFMSCAGLGVQKVAGAICSIVCATFAFFATMPLSIKYNDSVYQKVALEVILCGIGNVGVGFLEAIPGVNWVFLQFRICAALKPGEAFSDGSKRHHQETLNYFGCGVHRPGQVLERFSFEGPSLFTREYPRSYYTNVDNNEGFPATSIAPALSKVLGSDNDVDFPEGIAPLVIENEGDISSDLDRTSVSSGTPVALPLAKVIGSDDDDNCDLPVAEASYFVNAYIDNSDFSGATAPLLE